MNRLGKSAFNARGLLTVFLLPLIRNTAAVGAFPALAQLAFAANPPAFLTPEAGSAPGTVALDWPAVTGATGYQVKRADSPAGPFTILGSTSSTITSYPDTSAVAGQKYHYAVTTLDASGESASFRGAAASPGIIVDNADYSNITTTGSWPASGLAGCYGAESVYAATNGASAPTATCRFSPTTTSISGIPPSPIAPPTRRWTSVTPMEPSPPSPSTKR